MRGMSGASGEKDGDDVTEQMSEGERGLSDVLPDDDVEELQGNSADEDFERGVADFQDVMRRLAARPKSQVSQLEKVLQLPLKDVAEDPRKHVTKEIFDDLLVWAGGVLQAAKRSQASASE